MSNEYGVFVPASEFRLGASPTATAKTSKEARIAGGHADGLSVLAVKDTDLTTHREYWRPIAHYCDERVYGITAYAARSLVMQRKFNKQARRDRKS